MTEVTTRPDPGSTPSMDAMCHSEGSTGAVLRSILNRVGDKWTLMVMGMLAAGPLRFSELQRRVPGISQRMLTLTLRQAERDGLVTRTVYAEVPVRVEYRVSELGTSLVGPIMALATWAYSHQETVVANRAAYDAIGAGRD